MKKLINKNNYKKLLLINSICIIFCLFLLVTYFSYAMFSNKISLKLINSKVGNYKLNNSDISIEINKEIIDINGKKTGKYKIVKDIPELGYAYSSYKCNNNSLLLFDERKKLINIDAKTKDNCFIYFNNIRKSDITINIMVQDINDATKYHVSLYPPSLGYKFTSSSCANNSLISYDELTNKLTMKSKKNDICSIFYNVNSNNISGNIYINNKGTYEYIEFVPINKEYIIDEASVCRLNNEIVSAQFNIKNGLITINSVNSAKCDIILLEK